MKSIILILFALLFSTVDSFKINFKGFTKKLNLNVIPTNNADSILSKTYLEEHDIEALKIIAKNYQIEPVNDDDIVVLETSRGIMKLKLFHEIAPGHCNNFKKLANSGFYDETSFHRIIRGFMIQGGDINTRDNNINNDGQGSPGWTIDAEFNNIKHEDEVELMQIEFVASICIFKCVNNVVCIYLQLNMSEIYCYHTNFSILINHDAW